MMQGSRGCQVQAHRRLNWPGQLLLRRGDGFVLRHGRDIGPAEYGVVLLSFHVTLLAICLVNAKRRWNDGGQPRSCHWSAIGYTWRMITLFRDSARRRCSALTHEGWGRCCSAWFAFRKGPEREATPVRCLCIGYPSAPAGTPQAATSSAETAASVGVESQVNAVKIELISRLTAVLSSTLHSTLHPSPKNVLSPTI
jgi:hypothetical protein